MIDFYPPVLAIDWGRKYIGLAIGQSSLSIRPLNPLKNNATLWQRFSELITQEGIREIVIGRQADQQFLERIRTITDWPVRIVDEQLTSELVKKSGQHDPTPQSIHSLAACLILDQYLAERKRSDLKN